MLPFTMFITLQTSSIPEVAFGEGGIFHTRDEIETYTRDTNDIASHHGVILA